MMRKTITTSQNSVPSIKLWFIKKLHCNRGFHFLRAMKIVYTSPNREILAFECKYCEAILFNSQEDRECFIQRRINNEKAFLKGLQNE